MQMIYGEVREDPMSKIKPAVFSVLVFLAVFIYILIITFIGWLVFAYGNGILATVSSFGLILAALL